MNYIDKERELCFSVLVNQETNILQTVILPRYNNFKLHEAPSNQKHSSKKKDKVKATHPKVNTQEDLDKIENDSTFGNNVILDIEKTFTEVEPTVFSNEFLKNNQIDVEKVKRFIQTVTLTNTNITLEDSDPIESTIDPQIKKASHRTQTPITVSNVKRILKDITNEKVTAQAPVTVDKPKIGKNVKQSYRDINDKENISTDVKVIAKPKKNVAKTVTKEKISKSNKENIPMTVEKISKVPCTTDPIKSHYITENIDSQEKKNQNIVFASNTTTIINENLPPRMMAPVTEKIDENSLDEIHSFEEPSSVQLNNNAMKVAEHLFDLYVSNDQQNDKSVETKTTTNTTTITTNNKRKLYDKSMTEIQLNEDNNSTGSMDRQLKYELSKKVNFVKPLGTENILESIDLSDQVSTLDQSNGRYTFTKQRMAKIMTNLEKLNASKALRLINHSEPSNVADVFDINNECQVKMPKKRGRKPATTKKTKDKENNAKLLNYSYRQYAENQRKKRQSARKSDDDSEYRAKTKKIPLPIRKRATRKRDNTNFRYTPNTETATKKTTKAKVNQVIDKICEEQPKKVVIEPPKESKKEENLAPEKLVSMSIAESKDQNELSPEKARSVNLEVDRSIFADHNYHMSNNGEPLMTAAVSVANQPDYEPQNDLIYPSHSEVHPLVDEESFDDDVIKLKQQQQLPIRDLEISQCERLPFDYADKFWFVNMWSNKLDEAVNTEDSLSIRAGQESCDFSEQNFDELDVDIPKDVSCEIVDDNVNVKYVEKHVADSVITEKKEYILKKYVSIGLSPINWTTPEVECYPLLTSSSSKKVSDLTRFRERGTSPTPQINDNPPLPSKRPIINKRKTSLFNDNNEISVEFSQMMKKSKTSTPNNNTTALDTLSPPVPVKKSQTGKKTLAKSDPHNLTELDESFRQEFHAMYDSYMTPLIEKMNLNNKMNTQKLIKPLSAILEQITYYSKETKMCQEVLEKYEDKTQKIRELYMKNVGELQKWNDRMISTVETGKQNMSDLTEQTKNNIPNVLKQISNEGCKIQKQIWKEYTGKIEAQVKQLMKIID